MKNIIALLVLAASLSACTSKTQYGDCIGVLQEKKPNLTYELSVWNTVLAVVFSETIVVPIVVVANQHSCPVGVK
jgi:hypothetical protein